MNYIMGNCPCCKNVVIQSKIDIITKTHMLCLECKRTATTSPYTYKAPSTINTIDLGVQCSTIMKQVFPQCQ